jgi:hypothetical protein
LNATDQKEQGTRQERSATPSSHQRRHTLRSQGDALALTFANKGPLKLSKGSPNVEEQVRHRVAIASEGELLLHELDLNLLRRETPHDRAKVACNLSRRTPILVIMTNNAEPAE